MPLVLNVMSFMTSYYFPCLYAKVKMDFIVLLVLLISFESTSALKTRWLNLTSCSEPILPYAQNIPFEFNAELIFKKKNERPLMTENFTVKEDLDEGDKEGIFRYGQVQGERWKPQSNIKWLFRMNHIKCRSVAGRAILGSIGIPSLKSCYVKKGVYTFENIDTLVFDKVFHGVAVRAYGLYLAELEIVSGKFSLFCWKTWIRVSPN